MNEYPHSKQNKCGYRYKGEAFEEMMSLNGFLPNIQNRICTQTMKIFITNSFLSDWLAQKQGVDRLGHHGKTAQIRDEDVLRIHKAARGSTPDHILLAKRAFVRKSDFVREQALWKDFTGSDLCFANKAIKDSVLGDKAQLFGNLAIEYVSCLGIRKDEELRIAKIRARIDSAKHDKGISSLFNQPPGEQILAPLVEKNINQQDVIDFWKTQKFDLALPDTGLFSNCVYCPLKGKKKLVQIATKELSKNKQTKITPASIDWWVKMEKKYSRDLKAEKRHITSKKDVAYIGFFGATNKPVYWQIREQAKLNNASTAENIEAGYLVDESHVPCNCTD